MLALGAGGSEASAFASRAQAGVPRYLVGALEGRPLRFEPSCLTRITEILRAAHLQVELILTENATFDARSVKTGMTYPISQMSDARRARFFSQLRYSSHRPVSRLSMSPSDTCIGRSQPI
jgi:hypothetical protein